MCTRQLNSHASHAARPQWNSVDGHKGWRDWARIDGTRHSPGFCGKRLQGDGRHSLLAVALPAPSCFCTTAPQVVAVELEERFLESGMSRIKNSVTKLAEKGVAKGKMDQAQGEAHVAATLGRISATTDLSALSTCDIIIEAVIEDLGLKQKLYTCAAPPTRLLEPRPMTCPASPQRDRSPGQG